MLHETLSSLRDGALLLTADPTQLGTWAVREDGLMHLSVYLAVVYAALALTCSGDSAL